MSKCTATLAGMLALSGPALAVEPQQRKLEELDRNPNAPGGNKSGLVWTTDRTG